MKGNGKTNGNGKDKGVNLVPPAPYNPEVEAGHLFQRRLMEERAWERSAALSKLKEIISNLQEVVEALESKDCLSLKVDHAYLEQHHVIDQIAPFGKVVGLFHGDAIASVFVSYRKQCGAGRQIWGDAVEVCAQCRESDEPVVRRPEDERKPGESIRYCDMCIFEEAAFDQKQLLESEVEDEED